MTTVGLIYVGPVLGVWYKLLDQLVVGKSKTVAFKKMLLDQFALAPSFLACFLTLTGFLGGHSREEVWIKLKKDYKDTLISNYYIWPTVQMLNFYFVPLVYRSPSSMTPTPLIFLSACLLLGTRTLPAVCRAVDLSVFDKIYDPNINTATNEENDQSLSYILKEKLLQSFEKNPKYMLMYSHLPPGYLQMLKDIFAKEAGRFLREPSLNAENLMPTQEIDQDMVAAFAGRSKRPVDPPNSLDLTFHILREMIEIAKNENQWMQADNNRKIMETIGK
ncbi:UI-like isoform X2 [Chiloscyllium plagiosum]|nr:UI-like isoform X2 [Chiloscyllium plagiosum]XP_043538100.1 UI-like isoform X2 [Chiloscyllium plagiosum]XP_043538106.1 UI-like isoform X2 [Chiloscyllium plagiosum]